MEKGCLGRAFLAEPIQLEIAEGTYFSTLKRLLTSLGADFSGTRL
jgi:hypothetical protein